MFSESTLSWHNIRISKSESYIHKLVHKRNRIISILNVIINVNKNTGNTVTVTHDNFLLKVLFNQKLHYLFLLCFKAAVLQNILKIITEFPL